MKMEQARICAEEQRKAKEQQERLAALKREKEAERLRLRKLHMSQEAETRHRKVLAQCRHRETQQDLLMLGLEAGTVVAQMEKTRYSPFWRICDSCWTAVGCGTFYRIIT